jgi:hypothetical protein
MTTSPERASSRSTSSSGISMKSQTYGSVGPDSRDALLHGSTNSHHSTLKSFTSLQDEASKIAFLESTRTHHHPHSKSLTKSMDDQGHQESPLYSPLSSPQLGKEFEEPIEEEGSKIFFSHSNLRKLALDLSLWVNIFILLTKMVAYLETLSLSVLAALVDSILDVV